MSSAFDIMAKYVSDISRINKFAKNHYQFMYYNKNDIFRIAMKVKGGRKWISLRKI